MKRKKMMLILVLLLAIGFASVSTTLVITGVVGISSKQDDFDVIFTKAKLDGEDKNEFIDASTKQTINFTSKKLTKINETTTLEYEVTNKSRLYDADVSIVCNIVDNSGNIITNNYVEISYLPNTDKITVLAGKSEKGSITAKLIKSSTEDQSISVKCTLTARATEREELGNEYIPPYVVTFNTNGGEVINTKKEVNNGGSYGELPTPTKGDFEFLGWYTKDREKVEPTTLVKINEDHTLIAGWKNPNLTGYEISYDVDLDGIEDVGDEIAIGEEQFYVISHTTNELNALAKYNLMVGNEINTSWEATPLTNPTGIQDPNAKGYVEGDSKWYGTVKFSNDSNNYIGSIVEGYVNAYVDILNNNNEGLNATGRLITKEELEGLGCLSSSNICSSSSVPSWIYSTTYWTQSAFSDNNYDVWIVYSFGKFSNYNISFVDNFGVRPVITIPKSAP